MGKASPMGKVRSSTDNRINKVATRTRSSIVDNKTPTAKANSSKAMANSKVAMDKTHMASSLRTKVRNMNITRSIMKMAHQKQGTVNSNKATAVNNSNTANSKATAANNSREPTPVPEDLEHLELVQMAARRETEG